MCAYWQTVHVGSRWQLLLGAGTDVMCIEGDLPVEQDEGDWLSIRDPPNAWQRSSNALASSLVTIIVRLVTRLANAIGLASELGVDVISCGGAGCS